MSGKPQIKVATSASEEQKSYCGRVRSIIEKKFQSKPLAFVHTYGCQQNVSDSEKTKGMLIEMGYELTENSDEADFVLFNTCAVREHAEARVFGNVGELKHNKKEKPDMIIAICGCMVQQPQIAEKFKRSYPYVDILYGTHVRHRLPEFIYRHMICNQRVFEISMDNNDIVEGIPSKRDGTFKAWLPIMQGCNNFCTYCIVPYVRGRERSREPEAILAEARSLVADGVREITLLGQNVNSYGKGEEHGVTFADILRKINDIPGDFRIRFMTSHPKDCTEELLDAMRDCDKVCKYLHLPVQSGSSEVLSRMNRRYTAEQYLALTEKAKEKMPEIQISSDIIVGFPGETRDDFSKTLELIRTVEYYSLFTFIYSPRTGTPAAEMNDPISRKEKGEWFSELLAVQENISKKLNSALCGTVHRALCEEPGRTQGYISGRTDGNSVVEFKGDESLLGRFINIEIVEFDGILKGKIKE